MKRFAVIGLGNFGAHLARSLFRKGAEVLAVDINDEEVLNIKDSVTQAVVANALDKKALLSLVFCYSLDHNFFYTRFFKKKRDGNEAPL